MIFPQKNPCHPLVHCPSFCPFPGAFEGGSDFADFTSAAPTTDGFGDFVGRLMWGMKKWTNGGGSCGYR